MFRGFPLVALIAAGWSPPTGDRVEIVETRERVVDDRERFEPAEDPVGGERGEVRNPFTWTAPAGWTDAGSTGPLRAANFTFGEEGEGECYFGVMAGGGGGLADNVNRWRGQMGLEPLEESAVDELPRREFLGSEAVFVDLSGEFRGMGASEAQAGYRMLGLLLVSPGFTFYVKMTGPEELVADNRDAFFEFAGSIGFAGGGDAEQETGGGG